jgi:hypothetical protein
VIDFAKNFDETLWMGFQNLLITDHSRLKDNYVGLDPRQFECFPCLIENNQIICFSALQVSPDRWGHKIGRVSTRMWIHPSYRFASLTRFTGGSKYLNTTYCLPMQIEYAKQMDLDLLFISREENFKGFAEYINLVWTNCQHKFILEQEKFNVCGSLDPVPESCKQWVAYLELNNSNTWISFRNKFLLNPHT